MSWRKPAGDGAKEVSLRPSALSGAGGRAPGGSAETDVSHLCELVVRFGHVLLKEPISFVLIGFCNGKP